MAELERILGKFELDAETLSLLTLHLYEIYKSSSRYIRYYESLFDIPKDPAGEREQVAERLTEMMVLMEDVVWHSQDLTKTIRRALEKLDDSAK